MKIRPALVLLYLLSSTPVLAHEFWINPLEYSLPVDQPIVAALKSGTSFDGTSHPYIYSRTVSAKLTSRNHLSAVKEIDGADPAIRIAPLEEGTQILTYQSAPSFLVHDNLRNFREYLISDGLEWVQFRHSERDLPPTGFTEAFSRYAKSLVKVGASMGGDTFTGMPYELVALDNPYQVVDSEGLSVQLLANNAGVPDSLISIFQKLGAEPVQRVTTRTDKAGIAYIPFNGGGEFLISTVIMTEGKRHPWHSRWVSLTYQID